MSVPSSILIIGAGEFGLSTALAIVRAPRYSNCKITILDASTQLPNPSGSSVDTNRIVRSDYTQIPYAKLALRALKRWRDTSDTGWGGQGRYQESGIVLTVNNGADWYVRNSFEVVKKMASLGLEGVDIKNIEELRDQDAIRTATGHSGVSGDWGYANWGAGWADAEAVTRYAITSLLSEAKGRVDLRQGSKVRRLIFESTHSDTSGRTRCTGAVLEDGSRATADLVILAAGAWTPTLINLKGRAIATGQSLAYLNISDEEQRALGSSPIIFNLSIGMFITPPRGRELKVGHHGYGYRNLKKMSFADDGPVEELSVPKVGVRIPREAEQRCRKALADMIPEFGNREFSRTRVCWYCDTPDGNYLIDHHPSYDGLFIATGDSGHAFKLFPIIGEEILAAIERRLDPDLKDMWSWRAAVDNFVSTDDASRSGRQGALLDEELSQPRLYETLAMICGFQFVKTRWLGGHPAAFTTIPYHKDTTKHQSGHRRACI